MKNKKYLITTGIIIIVSVITIFFVRKDKLSVIPVKTVNLQDRVVEKTVSTSGVVTSEKEADLKFGVSGKINGIKVSKGDFVEKGTLIAYLDNYTLVQTAQSLKDSRDVAIRDKELYIEQYETNKDAVSGQDEYDIAVRRLDELISKAEASYQASQATVRDSYIYAPFNGYIIDIYKEEGENALTTENIVKIADIENLVFEIDLDQEDYGLVKENQKVNIILDAYDKNDFYGYVFDLPFYADGEGASIFVVKIKFENVTDPKPLLGMTGDANIVVLSSENPVRSVFYDEVFYDENDNPYVWVVKNDIISKQNIEIGIEGDIYTEIKSDIQNSVVVGLNDDVEVKDGYKAQIIK